MNNQRIAIHTLLFVLLSSICITVSAQPFITIWKTDNPGVTGNDQILIPGTGTNYTIAWEEVGNPANNGTETGNDATTVTFPSAGTYRVYISPGGGTFSRIAFNGGGDREKLTGIGQWGNIAWTSMENAFRGCSNLSDYTATDVPNLSAVTSLQSMFQNCNNFNGAIGNWDVSNVTNMNFMFAGADVFNQDIGDWDVRNVTNMEWMFYQADAFNQDIGDWDVRNVTVMEAMFYQADAFNQDIGGWDVRKVTNMRFMFFEAYVFNQDIGEWDVSNVTDMKRMFFLAYAFNQDISEWDVRKVTDMELMFYNAAFNQNLGNWKLNSSANLRYMLDESGLDCINYSATLTGWAANPGTPAGLQFGAEGLQFGTNAVAARNALLAKSWTIDGDSPSNTLCLPCPAGTVLYVNADATGANTGASWSDALPNLQDALTLAGQCPAITEIWVSAGTYRPDQGAGYTPGNRSHFFTMKNGVAIYGGFPNTGNPVFTDRNWVTNITTLSGDIDNPGNIDNSFHIIFNDQNGLDNTAVLDGFVISGGNANGNFPNNSGGGMFNSGSSPTIANCRFSNNSAKAGGGLFNDSSSSPRVSNCTFSGNLADQTFGGGGMYNTGSAPVVINCCFTGNTAGPGGIGGGMFNTYAAPSVTNCTFYNNTALQGGVMYNASSSPTVTNCIIWGNSSGIANSANSNPTVTYSIVQGSYAGNLNADPLFEDAANGNLRLQTCSPAVNAGDNAAVPSGITTDLDGNPRFFNSGTVDMGAYEFQEEPDLCVCTNLCTWTGALGTNWNTDGNWNPACVPTAANDVAIPNVANAPIILAGTAALANSVHVQTGGALTIENDGSLTINGFFDHGSGNTSGFRNEGTVANSGQLVLGNTAYVGDFVLWNQGDFNNNSGGEISIDWAGFVGLYNQAGTFSNSAKITIGGVAEVGSEGLHNAATFQNNAGGEISIDRSSQKGLHNSSGTFANAAKITIGGVAEVGSEGLHNAATFQNNTGGEISIDRSSGYGLKNISGSFINVAKITIGALANVGAHGIYNTATFQNNADGEVAINSSYAAGLKNDNAFINAGKITLGALTNIGTVGIENTATFDNIAGGEISIDRSHLGGLFNGSGTFTNSAKITIGAIADVGGEGIRNESNFHNNTCNALIHIVSNAVIMNSGGTFTNAGIIIENASGNSSTSSNSGVVQNLNGGTFSIGNNTGTLISVEGAIWTGCTSTDWNDADNWHNYTVPTATDHVTIPDVTNDPAIGAGMAAVAKSVHVQPDGSLIVAAAGSLTINGFFDYGDGNTAGLRNEGTVFNSGQLVLGSTSGVGDYGLWNQAAFTNYSGAEIAIDRSSAYGLYNETGTFGNSAKITIGANNNVGGYGLLNKAAFTNNSGAEIAIDRSFDYGLHNQAGTFGNSAKITIGANNSVGSYGLRNQAAFTNDSGAEIAIDRSSDYGLYNRAGTFNNSAKIIIGANNSVGSYGLWNQSAFQNNACAELTSFAPIKNEGGKTIANTGLFTVNTSDTHTNDGTFTNNGILSYPQGNPIPNVTNNEIIVAPTTSDDCQDVTPAFALGSPVDFTIEGVYADAAATISAGTYTPGNNTFIPTPALSDGNQYDYYVKIEDGIGSCTRILPWQVTVQDDTPPTANCQDITVSLDGNGDASILPAEVFDSGTDNCGAANPQNVSPDDFSCENLGEIEVTLTVSDGNGNTNTCMATVTVLDDTPPTANCQDITVSLDAQGEVSILPADVFAGGTDNCSTAGPQSLWPTNTFTCENLGENVVTLTVSDGNGNNNTCTATVTVQDNTLPSITCPNPVTVTCSTNIPAINLAAVTAGDNCNAPVKSHVGDATGNQICTSRKTVTRTYKAADASGNTKTCTQIITVYDDVKPNFNSVPANVTVQCNSVPPVGNATATDGCGGAVTVAYDGQTITNILCTDRYTITRQWTATDACGNTKTATQRITVQDTQKPVFSSIPANVTVQCNGIPDVGTPAATDNCDPNVTIDYNGETFTNGSCVDSYIVTRKWTATDNCGNTKTATQRITVQDTQKPVFTTVPQNLTIQCSDPAPAPGSASATDNCDTSVTILFVGQNTTYTNCPNNYTITRTWKATDNCGNWATATQTITVQDTQAPAFTFVPQHITIECSDLVPPIGQPTATDNCGGYVHIGFLGNASAAGDCPQEYVITRTWRATDECGHSTTATQTITVQDTQAPAFTNAPANLTLDCGAALPGVPAVSAQDNCDNQVSITYLGEENDGPDCPYTVTRTWETADDCGNVHTHTQTITVGNALEAQGSKFEMHHSRLELRPGGPGSNFKLQTSNFELRTVPQSRE